MALQTLNTIKNWFKTGLKPTQTQFWDTWDSFRHKYEKVPVKDIDGIDELLLSKADKVVLDEHLADKKAHAPQINTDWNSDSGFSQLLNKPNFKTINGHLIEGSGDIIIKAGGLQDLQQTLDNGSIAILDSGKATIALGTGTNGNKQTAIQHTDENTVAALSIDNRQVFIQTGSISKGTTGTVSLESTRAPYISYSTGGNAENKKETTITFENPNNTTTLNFPSKDEGTYTIATTSDITVPVSATQSGIVDNTPLQELGGADKYINGIRIGRGNNSTSLNNTVLGSNALMSSTTAFGNTAIGRSVLSSSTTGDYNTGVGSVALANLITGTQNVGVGAAALRNLTTGNHNLGIGASSLLNNEIGSFNVGLGSGAGFKVKGDRNVAVGYLSNGSGGSSNLPESTGHSNTTIGYQSGRSLSTGTNNTLIESPRGLTVTTGSYNVLVNVGDVITGLSTGSNNTLLGNISGLNADDSNLVVLANGAGVVALRKEADNRLIAPSLTNALITSGGAKSLVTKEYLDEKAQIKDKQIIVNGDIDVQENWNGQTIIFKNSVVVRMPIINTEEFSFNAITLEGVNLTWQWANQIEWVFGEPEITPEKKYLNLTKLGNTNQIILSV